jgi:hypothetical protein
MGKLNSIVGRGACKRLIGNKVDLAEMRVVEFEEGARRVSVPFSEVSAKQGTNVAVVFLALVDAILKKPEGWAAENPGEAAQAEQVVVDGPAAEEYPLGCRVD